MNPSWAKGLKSEKNLRKNLRFDTKISDLRLETFRESGPWVGIHKKDQAQVEPKMGSCLRQLILNLS